MDHDQTDRGQAPRPSAVALSSAPPLPDWWVLLAAEMDRLMRLLPPPGHTAEMIGQRSEAAGKYLAERYRNRPELVEGLRQVVTQGLATWTEFPPPSEIVRRIDQWLMHQAGRADLEAAAHRRDAMAEATRRLHAEQMAKVEAMKASGEWPPPGWRLDAKGLLERDLSHPVWRRSTGPTRTLGQALPTSPPT